MISKKYGVFRFIDLDLSGYNCTSQLIDTKYRAPRIKVQEGTRVDFRLKASKILLKKEKSMP